MKRTSNAKRDDNNELYNAIKPSFRVIKDYLCTHWWPALEFEIDLKAGLM